VPFPRAHRGHRRVRLKPRFLPFLWRQGRGQIPKTLARGKRTPQGQRASPALLAGPGLFPRRMGGTFGSRNSPVCPVAWDEVYPTG
jgi:hypothetical protein